MPHYAFPPQSRRQASREHIGESIGKGLQSIAEGYVKGQQIKQKQEEQKQIDTELNEAFNKMPEGLSPLQQAQYFANLRSPVREQAVKLMQNVPKQQAPRETIAPQQLFTNIVKKTLGNNPSEEEVARAEEIFEHGGPLLEQGVAPVIAYNQARKVVTARSEAKNVLKNQVQGPSFFSGDKYLKSDLSQIKKLKKAGVLDDDEIALNLIEKGYGPGDLEKFGIEVSPEFAEEIGIDVPEKTESLGKKKGKKKLTEVDIDRFMAESGNDPDKASELALNAGFDIEAQ